MHLFYMNHSRLHFFLNIYKYMKQKWGLTILTISIKPTITPPPPPPHLPSTNWLYKRPWRMIRTIISHWTHRRWRHMTSESRSWISLFPIHHSQCTLVHTSFTPITFNITPYIYYSGNVLITVTIKCNPYYIPYTENIPDTC